MNFNRSVFIMVTAIIFLCRPAYAQQNYASNISKSSDEEKMVITYDIAPASDAQSFSVVLFVTHNNKKIDVGSAYGDVGVNVSSGKEKAIVWYYTNDFDGNIAEVKVDVYAYKENEPQAIFKITDQSNSGYAPCEVTFSNSSQYANEYEWNFGDPASGAANLSFEQNPKHTYKQGGIYSISLTVRNTQSKLENTFYQSIEVKEYDPVVAAFQISGDQKLPPAKVSFKNSSQNADSYQWDFGDPGGGKKNLSYKIDGEYTYKRSGVYSVRLIAGNHTSGLRDTSIQDVVIEQKVSAVAAFVYTISSETAPATVTFKNTSKDGSKYEWNFGDKASGNRNMSSDTDPVHLYESAGTYSVELKVWGKGEKKPVSYSETIVVKELPKMPEAHFVIENNRAIGPATIVFSNRSTNATTYRWDFGDPESGDENSSTRTNPTHTYIKPGKYSVRLAASSPGFTRESIFTEWVEIIAPEVSAPPAAVSKIEPPKESEKPAAPPRRDESADIKREVKGEEVKKEVSAPAVEPKEVVPPPVAETFDPITHDTFIISESFGKWSNISLSVAPVGDRGYLTVLRGGEESSSIAYVNPQGKIRSEQRINSLVSDIIPVNNGKEFMIAGVVLPDKLFIQKTTEEFKPNPPVVFMERKSFRGDFALPIIELDGSGELGVAANTLDDRYPNDILFQKADQGGRIVPLANRTFKYVGNKMILDMVGLDNGGFAVTGYWQEDLNALYRILFATIDKTGVGEVHLVNSALNILGCSIENSYQGGYAIVRAEEKPGDTGLYEISFALLDEKGAPTDCAHILPAYIKREDILRYKPSIIRIDDGYLVACHGFSGVDYDISLFWIDRSGYNLVNSEQIKLPGNQMVMDLKKAPDGGYLITGSQSLDGVTTPLLIKTDPRGRVKR